MFACALRVYEINPGVKIRAFAMVRALGLVPDIDKIVEPATGTITYYQRSGKTHRSP